MRERERKGGKEGGTRKGRREGGRGFRAWGGGQFGAPAGYVGTLCPSRRGRISRWRRPPAAASCRAARRTRRRRATAMQRSRRRRRRHRHARGGGGSPRAPGGPWDRGTPRNGIRRAGPRLGRSRWQGRVGCWRVHGPASWRRRRRRYFVRFRQHRRPPWLWRIGWNSVMLLRIVEKRAQGAGVRYSALGLVMRARESTWI